MSVPHIMKMFHFLKAITSLMFLRVAWLQQSPPPPKDRREGLVRRPKGAHPKNPVGKFFFNFPLRDRREGLEAPEGRTQSNVPQP